MYVRKPEDCAEIIANDGCKLRELLHPARGAGGVRYSLAVARLDPGRATFPHRLTGESEAYYVLEGRGRLHVGADARELAPGEVALVPAGAEQWIESLGPAPLRFLNIVDPPWCAEHDVRTDGA